MALNSTKILGILVLLFALGCKEQFCFMSESCRKPDSANESTLPSLAPPNTPQDFNQKVSKSRGIRLDPAYFYSSHNGQSAEDIAENVVSELKQSGVNTLYLYAYNSIYGAYYATNYSHTVVENGYGLQNIFTAVTNEAEQQGLDVIAVVPLNNFKHAWLANSNWRVKQAGNVDYTPLADTYLLSASSSEFRSWYGGFIDDLISRHPHIDGVEAVEPTLDYMWNQAPDHNPAALSLFSTLHPSESVGSVAWKNFRSEQFLNLIAYFNQRVHSHSKRSYLVHTWTVQSNGHLYPSNTLKDNTGFDFIGVTKLDGEFKTDVLVVEFIWQQWRSEYGSSTFDPHWVVDIGNECIQAVNNAGGHSNLVLHVEISNFNGNSGSVTPSHAEFQQTLEWAKTLDKGISVYDYNQIKTKNAFSELAHW